MFGAAEWSIYRWWVRLTKKELKRREMGSNFELFLFTLDQPPNRCIFRILDERLAELLDSCRATTDTVQTGVIQASLLDLSHASGQNQRHGATLRE